MNKIGSKIFCFILLVLLLSSCVSDEFDDEECYITEEDVRIEVLNPDNIYSGCGFFVRFYPENLLDVYDLQISVLPEIGSSYVDCVWSHIDDGLLYVKSQSLSSSSETTTYHFKAVLTSSQDTAYRYFNVSEIYDRNILDLYETGLPLLVINTQDSVMPEVGYIQPPSGAVGNGMGSSTKVNCSVQLYKKNSTDNRFLFSTDSLDATIKYVGNQLSYPRPFKLKLGAKKDLLFRDDENYYSDKEWRLQCRDVLKNYVGFKANRLVGMYWTPEMQFVNLVVNGQNLGIYAISEYVKQSKSRVNVDNESGCIFEYDPYWWKEDYSIESSLLYADEQTTPFKYTLKYHNDGTDYTGIESSIQLMENCILNCCPQLSIDLDSWARWLLVQDILSQGDGYGSNLYLMKKDGNSKVQTITVWDLESIFYSVEGWGGSRGLPIIYNLLKSSVFSNCYKNIYAEISDKVLSQIIYELDSFLDSDDAAALEKSRILNGSELSVSDEISSYKEFLYARKSWLDGNL